MSADERLVCRDCGAPFVPVQRGQCSRCGSDATPVNADDNAPEQAREVEVVARVLRDWVLPGVPPAVMADLVLVALAPIREAERQEAAREALLAAAVQVSGVGRHREPCRLPDTSCLCGVCDFREEAARMLRDRADGVTGQTNDDTHGSGT